MSSCRKWRGSFIQALYDELTPEQRTRFEEHLKTCPKCAADYARFASTLRIMDQRERPEPEDVFWAGYWDRLAPRLETTGKTRAAVHGWKNRVTKVFAIQPHWAIGAAAAAALLVVGIFIGKIAFGPSAIDTDGGSHPVRGSRDTAKMTSLPARAERYLERSQILLLGLVNFDPETEDPEALDLTQQRAVSQQLVREAGLLKAELSGPPDRKLVALIQDLEVILLQIANLESEQDLAAIEMVKAGVDRRGILLKIDLEAMRQVEETDTAEPDRAGERAI